MLSYRHGQDDQADRDPPERQRRHPQDRRTYTHVVYVEGVSLTALQKNYSASVKCLEKQTAKYQKALDNYRAGVNPRECDPDQRPAGTIGGEWDRKCHAQYLADGEYEKWLKDVQKGLSELRARGQPTEAAVSPGVIGWCGRLDLATKLASSEMSKGYYYGIRVIPVDE